MESEPGGNYINGDVTTQQNVIGADSTATRTHHASAEGMHSDIPPLPHLGDLLDTELMILGMQTRRVYEDEI